MVYILTVEKILKNKQFAICDNTNYNYVMNKLFSVISLCGLYVFWIASQYFLRTDIYSNVKIIDRMHDMNIITYANNYLKANHDFAWYCMVITTMMIDFNILYFVYEFIIHDNKKPMIKILFGVILRQFCQYINRLPIPDGMFWFDPGFPTLVMDYNVTNDFFFSGHTFMSLVFGTEFIKSKYQIIRAYGVIHIICEIVFIMCMRAHYFMDMYAALMTFCVINNWVG